MTIADPIVEESGDSPAIRIERNPELKRFRRYAWCNAALGVA
jgi:hypothetical protein